MLSLGHRSLFCCILVGLLRLNLALGGSQELGDLGPEGKLLEEAVAEIDGNKLANPTELRKMHSFLRTPEHSRPPANPIWERAESGSERWQRNDKASKS